MHPKVFKQKEKALDKKFKKLESLLDKRQLAYKIQQKKCAKEYIELERLDRRVYRINFLLGELTQESCDLVDEYQGRNYYDEMVECA